MESHRKKLDGNESHFFVPDLISDHSNTVLLHNHNSQYMSASRKCALF